MEVTRVRMKKEEDKRGSKKGKKAGGEEHRGGGQLGFMGHWRGMQALVLRRNNNTLEGAIRKLGRQGAPDWSSV